MSTPASIPEALDMIDKAISYSETPEFKALPVETRLGYFDQVAAIARVMKARTMTESIRRRWDGRVSRAYERPMTGSVKVSWSGCSARARSAPPR
jgi:hypothetical protein